MRSAQRAPPYPSGEVKEDNRPRAIEGLLDLPPIMPLLEPMRAFSGRMRNYYSGSRFAYIRLNGAEATACSFSRALHAEFYELFAILAAPSETCGLHGHRAGRSR